MKRLKTRICECGKEYRGLPDQGCPMCKEMNLIATGDLAEHIREARAMDDWERNRLRREYYKSHYVGEKAVKLREYWREYARKQRERWQKTGLVRYWRKMEVKAK